MKDIKEVKLHNKSDKPDNIIEKENEIFEQCEGIEMQLPKWLKGYFIYLKTNLLPMSRLAYLRDTHFFFKYLINETDLRSEILDVKDLKISHFEKIKAMDVNIFIDYCRRYKIETKKNIYVYENDKSSLSRKKSSVSVLFKYLYRDELVSKNITDGFDPIRLPKPGEREIKALQDDEVMRMLDAAETGQGLTKHEFIYWEKTKYRDKLILLLLTTYGLRLSELQQLNLSSFNFDRGEFKIYRKRGKESMMPINRTITKAFDEYIHLERRNENSLDAEHKDALLLSIQGSRLTDRQIREIVKKYTSISLKTSRKKGYSPHKLRATAATSLIGRGNSIYDVQELMDHDNVTTTQLYAAHKLNTKRELIKNFEWDENLPTKSSFQNEKGSEEDE
ncbi:MAG: recombinase [Clostridia bacterium]|nr:recombinase [Clostridia bacterium]